MEIDSDEKCVEHASDTLIINHHMKIEDAFKWIIMTEKNVRTTYIRTPRVKKGHKFSEKLPRLADIWHGVEFTVPVKNVEIYIETLSDNALENPNCEETSKTILFTAEEAQSWFPEEPWPMLIHPMSCIRIKFEYKFPLPVHDPNKMICVIHHIEHLTTKSRERLLGCPVRNAVQTRAEQVITTQWENISSIEFLKKINM